MAGCPRGFFGPIFLVWAAAGLSSLEGEKGSSWWSGKGFTAVCTPSSHWGQQRGGTRCWKCRGWKRGGGMWGGRYVAGLHCSSEQLWLTPPEFLLRHRGTHRAVKIPLVLCCPSSACWLSSSASGGLGCTCSSPPPPLLPPISWSSPFLGAPEISGGLSWYPEEPCMSSQCSWHPCSTRDASSKESLHSAA